MQTEPAPRGRSSPGWRQSRAGKKIQHDPNNVQSPDALQRLQRRRLAQSTSIHRIQGWSVNRVVAQVEKTGHVVDILHRDQFSPGMHAPRRHPGAQIAIVVTSSARTFQPVERGSMTGGETSDSGPGLTTMDSPAEQTTRTLTPRPARHRPLPPGSRRSISSAPSHLCSPIQKQITLAEHKNDAR